MWSEGRQRLAPEFDVARRTMPRLALALLVVLAACGEDAVVTGPDVVADVQVDGLCGGVACGGCGGAADDTPCDDGDPCTGDDRCAGGVCVGPDLGCACRVDGDCQGVGDLCTGAATCDTSALPYACRLPAKPAVSCAPSGPCVEASCVAATGACVQTPRAADIACDDGDACTADDRCDGAGACVGVAGSCPCASDDDCAQDADLCTARARCDVVAGQCALDPATAQSCGAPSLPCRSVACVPATGVCVESLLPDGSACDDGVACTEADACAGGSCVGVALACPCTADADCEDDGDLCNGQPFCNKQQGVCATNPTTVVSCPTVDDTACAIATCAPKTGQCALVAIADGAPCDDGNSCSQGESCAAGACSGGSNACACESHADCAALDDGNACNGSLYCDSALKTCVTNPATVVVCKAASAPCTQVACAPATGACVSSPLPDGSACDDGEKCTASDTCEGGACSAGKLVCPCLDDADCAAFDDADLCNGSLKCVKVGDVSSCVVDLATAVTCTAPPGEPCLQAGCVKAKGTCYIAPRADGSPCDDGKACTGGDACSNGACVGAALACDDDDACTDDACVAAVGGCVHTLKSCDDGNPCTLDGCDAGVCDHTALVGGCDDGDACTGPDLCEDGACAAPAVDCADEASCTVDSCAADVGCVHLPLDATACDDGIGCTGPDVCKAGVCVGLPAGAGACDDGEPCTIDVCHAQLDCLHLAVLALPCSDGDACTKGDACTEAGCVGQKLGPGACDDGNPCTADGCDAAKGCTHEALSAGAGGGPACDDGDPCTTGDHCAAGACTASAVLPCACKQDADCKGGDLCLGKPRCNQGALPYVCDVVPGSAVACDTSNDGACRSTSCTPATGACKVVELSDGALCGTDGDACKAGTCKSGLCIPTGAPLDCDDGVACTVDLCLKSKGCVHDAAALDGKACDDGDACTGPDVCAAGACKAGGAASCDDGNACTADSCTSDKGCAHAGGALDGKGCDDGDACTSADACAKGGCVAGPATDCDDGAPCTFDACTSAVGCSHDAAPFEAKACDDGDGCSEGDTCVEGVCKGKGVDCDDGNACTVDACSGGACSHLGASLEGKACTHAVGCVQGTVCKGGVCSGGDAAACGDTGDCSVQPDALGVRELDAKGRVDASFDGAGAGRIAAVDAAGEVAVAALDWPIPTPYKPLYVVAGPATLAPPPAVAVHALADGGVLLGGGAYADVGGGAKAWRAWLWRLGGDGAVAWKSAPVAALAAPLRDIVALGDGSVAAVASVDTAGRSTALRLTTGGEVLYSVADKGGDPNDAGAERWALEQLLALDNAHVLAVGAVLAPAGSATSAPLAVRYDAAGKRIYASTPGALGAGVDARWHAAALRADGTVITVGAHRAGASAPTRPLIGRLGSAGALVFHKELAGISAKEAAALGVQIAKDGGAVVAGTSHGGDGASKVWLAHLGAGDAPRWVHTLDDAKIVEPCAGCLGASANDGWRVVAGAWPVGADAAVGAPRSIRFGAFGAASCAAAGACGNKDLGDCADGYGCTADGCDPATGCVFVPNDAACDDGNVCTADGCVVGKGCVSEPVKASCEITGACEVAACAGGKCKATSELIDCKDDDPCTFDGCASALGCTHTKQISGSRCLDDDNCVQGLCGSAKACQSAKARDCNDFEACTLDACSKGKGCSHVPASDGVGCSDGDACTSAESCKAGVCGGGKVKNCPSGQACTAGSCHSTTCGGGNKGLTFTVVSRDAVTDVMRIVAYADSWGYPPKGNPYVGDIACTEKLPVLCLRVENVQPPKPQTAWSKGSVRASQPVYGCGVRTQSAGNKVCSDRFGAGWTWFQWHTSGQESFAHGDLPLGTRGWTYIGDQAQGTCAK